MNDFEAVKQRADIVDIIGQFVPLKRAGRNYSARCPFHQEKTASFHVDPARQSWRCFGACNEGGDVFGFFQRRDNLTAVEALREVARLVGYELTDGAGTPREDYSRLIEANEAAAQYFRHLLLTADAAAEARAYVEKRGVDGATSEAFQLGYALNSYEMLRLHLAERGFTDEEMLQAGLLSEGERGAYDRFRDRLIFPIRDERGRAIGFGGRVLGDGLPKYLNSPQTSLFDKSGTLYALDRAKDAIRAAQSALVVEGYMDVIAAHQYGIKNVVATLGTALTEKHVQILKRYTKRALLAMDADASGQQAMNRVLAAMDSSASPDPAAPVEAIVDWTGMVRLHAVSPVEIRVFTWPGSEGKDFDELIRSDAEGSRAIINAAWETASPPFEFRLRHELSTADRTDARAMVELADRLLPALAAISDRALQARYLSNLANATGVREEDLRGRLREGRAKVAPAAMPLRERASRPAPRAAEQEPAEAEQDPIAPAHGPVAGAAQAKQEMLCLRLLYSFESLRTDGMLLEEDLFTDAANRYLFQVWRGSPDLARVPEQLDDTMAAQLSAVLHVPTPPFDGAQAARALTDAVSRMRLRRLEERKRLMIGAVRDAEATVNRTRMAELAHSFFRGDDNLPEKEAESEAALETLRDYQAAVEFHQMETAIRLGMTRQQT